MVRVTSSKELNDQEVLKRFLLAAGAIAAFLVWSHQPGRRSAKEIITGLKAAVLQGLFVPVMMTDVETMIGVKQLMSALVNLIPSPAENKPVKVEGAKVEGARRNRMGVKYRAGGKRKSEV